MKFSVFLDLFLIKIFRIFTKNLKYIVFILITVELLVNLDRRIEKKIKNNYQFTSSASKLKLIGSCHSEKTSSSFIFVWH